MSDRSAIEWTDATWNPVTGCTKVSPGCAHCYAEKLSLRHGWSNLPWTFENAVVNVVLHPDRLGQPLRWRKPRMIFVCSMSDLFHERVPDEFLDGVYASMALAPQHTFQVLTKRPDRARAYYWSLIERDMTNELPLPNVWLGVSIENARYTWRADVLREIPAAVRFISAEPLLGSLYPGQDSGNGGVRPSRGSESKAAAVRGRSDRDHRAVAPLDLTGIDWLIVGGESGGRQARPMHPEWARELRDACRDQYWRDANHGRSVWARHERPAFFFKQWGSWVPYEEDVQPPLLNGQDGRQIDGHALPAELAEHEPTGGWWWPGPDDAVYRYAGASAKSGGRLLDGRDWQESPIVLNVSGRVHE